jgi:16S rRNA (cytosine1402-N4)-methyltransferase
MRSLSTNVVEDPRSAPFHLCQSGIHPDDALFVERLRMVQPSPFTHRPVMLDEIVELFASVPAGVVIDATLGGAGHSSALLEKYPHLTILGLDQDPAAVAAATGKLTQFVTARPSRAVIRGVRFDEMREAATGAFPGVPVVGVLFDLGVSSPQLDIADRGFSYRNDGPLDMRMNTTQELSASTVANEYDRDELTRVLFDGGEEQFASRIANAIIAARPLHSTHELAEVVRNATPAFARRRKGDPAKRSFQAIRLEVNQELDVLSRALDVALDLVVTGGRVVTLAYHSGEDRMIKQRFFDASTGGCVCPQNLPCVCGAIPKVHLITRGSRKPTTEEVRMNPRSESARLRAIEVVASDTGDPK